MTQKFGFDDNVQKLIETRSSFKIHADATIILYMTIIAEKLNSPLNIVNDT